MPRTVLGRAFRWGQALLLGLCLGGGAWRCAHQPQAAGAAPAGPAAQAINPAALLRVAEIAPQLLDEDKQQRLLRLAQAQPCPCPDSRLQLARCAVAEESCVRARFAVRSIARGLDNDAEDKEIRERLMERFGPREPEIIDLSSTSCRGSVTAPVTMVVFSDFECPFCAMAARLVDQLAAEVGDQLRICFKQFPLSSIHKQALLAAKAALAAGRQDKFWPMHDALYADQETLDRQGLLERAGRLGLDLARFEQDLDSPQIAEAIKRDLAEAQRLRLAGTPTFFINGREMTDPKSRDVFLDWIAEARALGRQAAAATPSGP